MVEGVLPGYIQAGTTRVSILEPALLASKQLVAFKKFQETCCKVTQNKMQLQLQCGRPDYKTEQAPYDTRAVSLL